MVALATEGLVRSAHDCSDGGIAVTIAESCFDTGGVGAEVSLEGVEPSTRSRHQRSRRALRRIGVTRSSCRRRRMM